MWKIGTTTAFVVALLTIGGCGGSGGVLRPPPPLTPPRTTPTATEADGLLDRALLVNATCKATAGTRFHCGLPDLEGAVDIELKRVGGAFVIHGCPSSERLCTLRNPRSARRTVGEESPSETYAASLLAGPFGGLNHVTCAQTGHRHFNCDGVFDEEGIHDAVNVDLEVVKHQYHFIDDCRPTKVWAGAVPLACQRLAWNVNFPESEMLEMSRGPRVIEAPAGR